MANLNRIAPILPVQDVRASIEYYRRLGFHTREYEKGGYGFATRDGVEIHLGLVPDGTATHPGSAYLWVDDADELAQEWITAGGQVHRPEDTEWGQHEGVLIDLDQNIIRFGSPIRDRSDRER